MINTSSTIYQMLIKSKSQINQEQSSSKTSSLPNQTQIEPQTYIKNMNLNLQISSQKLYQCQILASQQNYQTSNDNIRDYDEENKQEQEQQQSSSSINSEEQQQSNEDMVPQNNQIYSVFQTFQDVQKQSKTEMNSLNNKMEQFYTNLQDSIRQSKTNINSFNYIMYSVFQAYQDFLKQPKTNLDSINKTNDSAIIDLQQDSRIQSKPVMNSQNNYIYSVFQTLQVFLKQSKIDINQLDNKMDSLIINMNSLNTKMDQFMKNLEHIEKVLDRINTRIVRINQLLIILLNHLGIQVDGISLTQNISIPKGF